MIFTDMSAAKAALVWNFANPSTVLAGTRAPGRSGGRAGVAAVTSAKSVDWMEHSVGIAVSPRWLMARGAVIAWRPLMHAIGKDVGSYGALANGVESMGLVHERSDCASFGTTVPLREREFQSQTALF